MLCPIFLLMALSFFEKSINFSANFYFVRI